MVCEQIRPEAPTTKENKTKKKVQKEEDEIKRKLHEANQAWDYWNFKIHWDKIEQVNPRSHDERKNPFCVSSKRICFRDNVETAH